MIKYLYKFVSGLIIGTCMILPGVSGSVVAIMLGIYEYVIFLINSKKSYLYKIKELFPILTGIIIGMFVFGKILLLFYNKYTSYMICVFIGLMIGSIPILKSEIIQKNEKINYRILFVSLAISLVMVLTPKIINVELSKNLNYLKLFLGGFLYISGKIIPGVSSSFFLMILGLYNYLLKIVTNPFDITLETIISLIPFLLGIIVGFIVFMKLINYLLNNYFSMTYSGIIGFIISSTIVLCFRINFSSNYILLIGLMIFSYEFVNILSKKSQKN